LRIVDALRMIPRLFATRCLTSSAAASPLPGSIRSSGLSAMILSVSNSFSKVLMTEKRSQKDGVLERSGATWSVLHPCLKALGLSSNVRLSGLQVCLEQNYLEVSSEILQTYREMSHSIHETRISMLIPVIVYSFLCTSVVACSALRRQSSIESLRFSTSPQRSMAACANGQTLGYCPKKVGRAR
jgi:hypothetical protein